MKKFLKIIFCFIVLLFNLKAYAADAFVPYYTDSVNYFGTGALRVSNNIIIYEAPDKNSKIINKIYWDNTGTFLNSSKRFSRPSDIFLTYVPRENTAFISAEDMDEEWVKVCYDQRKMLFGWVNIKDEDAPSRFYTYPELIFKFGKRHGMYVFKNLPEEYKTLYSAPNKDSKHVDKFDAARHISPWLVQGNWVLVKVTMWDSTTKTGWLRWRSDEGKLFAFVNVK